MAASGDRSGAIPRAGRRSGHLLTSPSAVEAPPAPVITAQPATPSVFTRPGTVPSALRYKPSMRLTHANRIVLYGAVNHWGRGSAARRLGDLSAAALTVGPVPVVLAARIELADGQCSRRRVKVMVTGRL
jgi:hypothetical protein